MAIEDRGFASLDPKARREMARKGGRTAHLKGVARKWTPQEAATAGAKGRKEQTRRAKVDRFG